MKPTPSDVDHLLRDLDRSGLSVAAFARDRGVPAHRVYWARRRARQRAPESDSADFGEVTVLNDATVLASPIELRMPGGVSVLLSADFDEVALRRLLTLVMPC
jgi:hypothetical protein